MYGCTPFAAGFEALVEPEEMGLSDSPPMLEGGVSRLLMLEVDWCGRGAVEAPGRWLLNLARKAFVGSSSGPGRFDVAVLREVKLDPGFRAGTCGAVALCGGNTAAMLYSASVLNVLKDSMLWL